MVYAPSNESASVPWLPSKAKMFTVQQRTLTLLGPISFWGVELTNRECASDFLLNNSLGLVIFIQWVKFDHLILAQMQNLFPPEEVIDGVTSASGNGWAYNADLERAILTVTLHP